MPAGAEAAQDAVGPALKEARARFAHWQARATQAGHRLRAPPPEPTTCCGRGCNGCVWEGFYAAAQYWCEEAQLRLEDCADASRAAEPLRCAVHARAVT